MAGRAGTHCALMSSSQAQVPCTCRAHVEGPSCDHCKPGFWGLSPSNPEGCTRESGRSGRGGLRETPGGGGGVRAGLRSGPRPLPH